MMKKGKRGSTYAMLLAMVIIGASLWYFFPVVRSSVLNDWREWEHDQPDMRIYWVNDITFLNPSNEKINIYYKNQEVDRVFYSLSVTSNKNFLSNWFFLETNLKEVEIDQRQEYPIGTFYHVANEELTFDTNEEWTSAETIEIEYGGTISFRVHDYWEYSNWHTVETPETIIFPIEYVSDNVPPAKPITPVGPSTIETLQDTFFSTGTTDPNDDDIQYRFDWGDGTFSPWGELIENGNTFTAMNQWSNPGTYYVKSQARDQWGMESEWSSAWQLTVIGDIPVPPLPPTIDGPTYLDVGEEGDFIVTPQEISSLIVYWGDGNYTEIDETDSPVTVQKQWTQPNTYSIYAYAERNGAQSDASNEIEITIGTPPEPPEPPTTPTGPNTLERNQEGSFSTTSPVNGEIRFRWGDGTMSNWIDANANTPVTTTNSWSTPGIYYVRAQTRKDYLISDWSESLHVDVIAEVEHVTLHIGDEYSISGYFTAGQQNTLRIISDTPNAGSMKFTLVSAGQKVEYVSHGEVEGDVFLRGQEIDFHLYRETLSPDIAEITFYATSMGYHFFTIKEHTVWKNVYDPIIIIDEQTSENLQIPIN